MLLSQKLCPRSGERGNRLQISVSSGAVWDRGYISDSTKWMGPMDRMPRKILIGWVENARPSGCPKMTWGRMLNKALKSYDIPTDFGQWSILAADRKVWQQRIGIRAPCPRPATSLIHDKWRELFDGPT